MANTITLPAAATRAQDNPLTVRNASVTKHLEVHPAAGDTLFTGTSYYIVPPYDSQTYQSDGVSMWATISSASRTSIRWRGEWQQGSAYYQGDAVTIDNWLMHANKETYEPAKPQEAGNRKWELPEVPAWTAGTYNTSLLLVGNKFTIQNPAWWYGYRAWIPAIGPDIYYRSYHNDLTDPANPKTTYGTEFSPTQTGWVTVPQGAQILLAGETHEVGLYSRNLSNATEFKGNWDYTTPQNDNIPGSGVVSQSVRQNNEWRINATDYNNASRYAELATLQAGDTITHQLGTAWNILGVTDNGSWLNIEVTPIWQAQTGVYEFTFALGEDLPLDYVRLPNHWLGNPNASGFYQLADGTRVDNDDAYGFDIDSDQITLSNDWDFMSGPV